MCRYIYIYIFFFFSYWQIFIESPTIVFRIILVNFADYFCCLNIKALFIDTVIENNYKQYYTQYKLIECFQTVDVDQSFPITSVIRRPGIFDLSNTMHLANNMEV